MTVEQAQIIPTRYRTKIPQTLSYPIGAMSISEALLGAPQFNELILEFRFLGLPVRSSDRTTPYQILRAQYSGPGRYDSAHQIDGKGQWTIIVEPVPRTLRHMVQEKVLKESLPSMKAWLIANYHSNEREGENGLTFSLDELKFELIRDERSSLQWKTPRAI